MRWNLLMPTKTIRFLVIGLALLVSLNGCNTTHRVSFGSLSLKIEQPFIDDIYRVGDQIIVSTDHYNRTTHTTETFHWYLNEKKKLLVSSETVDKEKLIAVYGSRKYPVKAYKENNKIRLTYPLEPQRNIIVSLSTDGAFRLAANMDHTFLVFEDQIVVISANTTLETTLSDKLFKDKRSFQREGLPRFVAVTDKHLLLGFDRGEWGGGAYAIPIDESGSLGAATELLSENVCAIDIDSSGIAWIASGLSHLSIQEGGLTQYDGKSIKPVLSIPTETEISGITVNGKDEVLFVAARAGIFAYQPENRMNRLWKGDLYVSYSMSDYSVGSFPQGVAEKGNKLYVASRSLGVLQFVLDEEGNYILKDQFVFE